MLISCFLDRDGNQVLFLFLSRKLMKDLARVPDNIIIRIIGSYF